jgi:hypothetical protein
VDRPGGAHLYEPTILGFAMGPNGEILGEWRTPVFFAIAAVFALLCPTVLFLIRKPFETLTGSWISRERSLMWIMSGALILLNIGVLYVAHPVMVRPWLRIRTDTVGMEITEIHGRQTLGSTRVRWDEVRCLARYHHDKAEEHFPAAGLTDDHEHENGEMRHPFTRYASLLTTKGTIVIDGSVNGYHQLLAEVLRESPLQDGNR